MATLLQLLDNMEIIAKIGKLSISIKGVTDDSREVKAGYAFVCMPAIYESQNARWVYSVDGDEFIPGAIKNGAAAIISQNLPELAGDNVAFIQVQDARYALAKIAAEFYGNPSRKLIMIAVTGTNGKTSTCYLSNSILKAGNINTAVSGTIVRRIAGNNVAANMTTPEAHRLQKMLNDALKEGLDGVIMEASSHALELKRVDCVEFDVAVFTGLTQDHLDFHIDMSGYLASKTKLFRDLMKKKSFAIVNADDPAGEHIIQNTDAKVLTYAIHAEADLKVTSYEYSARGLSFKVSIQGNKELEVTLQLLGEYNLYNALAAMGVGLSQGIDIEMIKAGLENVSSIPGRFERVDCGQDYTVVVDYAHTHDALERVLKAARKLTDSRLITVFGCGGDRDNTKRPLMGHVATDLSDYSIITSDNPRSEDPMHIISQILDGVKGGKYETIPDRRSAIKKAIEMAQENDIVVIAGKGHEDYQILKDGKIHFDDREVASEFIGLS